MSCTIQEIKVKGINKAKTIFKGKAKSITFDKDTATISYGSEYQVKTEAQAYNMIQTKIKKIDDWTKDTFKTDSLKGQWTRIYQNNGKLSVEFMFPKALYDGYKRKIEQKNNSNILLKKPDWTTIIDNSKQSIFTKGSKKNTVKTTPEHKIDVLFNGKQGKITVNEILNNIRSNFNGISQESKDVIEKIDTFAKLTKAKIKFVAESVLETDDTIMQYDEVTDTIMLSRNRLKGYSAKQVAESFLHEVTHSITVKVINNPTTMDAKMAVSQLEEIFKTYKEKSTGKDTYGFTNIHEFVAEARNNSTFQNELKELDKDKNSLWQRLVKVIRTLLGLKSNYQNTLDAIMTLEKESTKVDVLKTSNRIFRDSKEKEKDEKDLSTVENRLEKRREDLMHIVKLQMRKLERGDKKKTKSFTADLKIALTALEKYQGLDTYKGIIEYLKNATSALTAMESALMTKDMSTEDMKYALKTNRDYFQLYSIVKDIQHSKRDIFRSNPDISEEDKDTVNRLLSTSTGKYESLHGLYQTAAKDFMSNHLNNVKYHPAIVTRWEEKFRKEYNEIHQGNKKALNDKITREEWVTGKLLEVNDEIKVEIEDNVEKLIYNKAYDISTYTRWFLSSIETNDDMVQIMQVMLSEIRDNIIRDVLPINKEMAELHTKFVKGKSNNPTKLYKNIFEKTSGGKFYLKGAIKAEFGHKYAQLEALRDQIRDLNVNSLSEDDKLLLVDLKKERDALHNELFLTYNNTLKSEIKSVWKNDLSKLTEDEKEILEYFKKVSDDSAEVSHGWNTLKNLVIYDGNKKITYYRLPAISKNDTERMLDGTLGKDRMARVKDKFQVQSDDIGYEHTKRVNIDGSDIMDLKLHFRGDMEEGNQSVDLFSLYKMEVNNYIAYKHRNKNKIDIDLFLNIAEDKDYIHDKNSMSWLTKSQISAKHDVKESNTVMKLRGIVENQMYDITKRFSGKVAGADVNKIIGTLNGYTGMVGMTLNYFSATANAISGNAQTLIHGMAKDIVSTKDLNKAMGIYIKNTGANINDLGKVYDESFTNQILNEFDVFGGFNIGTESFLKDAKWKSIVSKHSLQFMHTMGEHQIQAVMTMAVLNSIQAYDVNGKSINGTSLLDNLSVDKDTKKLKMNKDVVYTSHSKLIKWNEGGRSEVQRLIKSKMIATQGLYDNNLQSELMKTAVGRLGNMYRKFFIPMAMERFRGTSTAFKDRSSLEEHEKYYSYSEKRYKEGTYVSLLNYIRNSLIPLNKELKFEIATTGWKDLTDYQKSNIRKAGIEFLLANTMALLASMAANTADGDDDEFLYFIAYEMARVESELSQFRNINDTFRMTQTPFASMHILENNAKFLLTLQATLNPFSETPRVKSGKNKGDLKLKKRTQKLFPIFNRVGVTNKERYNYLKILTNSN